MTVTCTSFQAAMKAMWEAQRKQKSILANLADAFKVRYRVYYRLEIELFIDYGVGRILD